MKNDFHRTLQILSRDKMMDVSSLGSLVSNEVAERLSNFLYVTDIESRVKVTDNGSLEILVALKSSGIKSPSNPLH